MNLQKCDKCKKKIQERPGSIVIAAYSHGIDRVDLCQHCSPALVQYLVKYAKLKPKAKVA